ncbi:MAG: TonB family protein [Candidatus Acidiferrales bacterium]
MAPLIKDSVDVANPATETTAQRPSAQPAKPTAAAPGVRADAVSVEVPVRVYGSRITQVPGQAEPNSEPFEEQTSTMIVFPQGAVLRMSTSVNIGQMLVVTNAKTKADAICRVVKVRTFSNTQGYVEVEFTTAQPNYWTVRFPSDGPTPPAAAPAAPVKAAAPSKPVETPKSPVAPVAPVAAAPTVQTPKAVAPVTPAIVLPAAAPAVPPPTVPVAQTFKPAAPAAVAPPSVVAPVVQSVAKVEAPATAPPAPVAATPVTPSIPDLPAVEDEDLDTILNRLAPSSPVSSAPSLDAIFATKLAEPVASAPAIVETPKPAPAIDFPAAPPPAPVPSLTLSELRGDSIAETSSDSDDTEVIEHDAILKHASAEPVVEAPRRTFGSFSGGASLTGGSSLTAPSAAESSVADVSSSRAESSSAIGGDYAAPPKQSNFLMIAACIGVLALVAGAGVFYFRTSAAGGKTTTPSASAVQPAKAPETEAAGETSEQTALRNTVAANNAPAQHMVSAPATVAPVTTSTAAEPSNADLNVTPNSTRTHAATTAANAKAIENVVDASANAHPVTAQRTDADAPSAAPVLDAPSSGSGNALSGLVSGSDGSALKAPEIHVEGPVRVGGNVKEPQIISHVMPIYPLTAKEAGIQGDVVIQTTIDQMGNVVNTKVVSGPMMLRGPALDALKRWKYTPSTLNGQPISVQMSVTIKFSNR